jgi:hypothetical protein
VKNINVKNQCNKPIKLVHQQRNSCPFWNQQDERIQKKIIAALICRSRHRLNACRGCVTVRLRIPRGEKKGRKKKNQFNQTRGESRKRRK